MSTKVFESSRRGRDERTTIRSRWLGSFVVCMTQQNGESARPPENVSSPWFSHLRAALETETRGCRWVTRVHQWVDTCAACLTAQRCAKTQVNNASIHYAYKQPESAPLCVHPLVSCAFRLSSFALLIPPSFRLSFVTRFAPSSCRFFFFFFFGVGGWISDCFVGGCERSQTFFGGFVSRSEVFFFRYDILLSNWILFTFDTSFRCREMFPFGRIIAANWGIFVQLINPLRWQLVRGP